MCGHSSIPNILPLKEVHPPIMDKAEQSRTIPIKGRAFSHRAYTLAGSSPECTLFVLQPPEVFPSCPKVA